MTPNMQRIGILVIAVVMVVGTIGLYIGAVLSSENATNLQNQENQQLQELFEQQQAEAKELSDTYYPVLSEYENRPSEFDAEAVGDAVTFVDLKVGEGETLTKDSLNYRAYYMGWNPKGKMFDSSFSGESLKAPLDLSQGRLIDGWYDGVDGMKVGGVREITIPSDLAYGEAGGAGGDIPPNTPIKFIIFAIPPAEIEG